MWSLAFAGLLFLSSVSDIFYTLFLESFSGIAFLFVLFFFFLVLFFGPISLTFCFYPIAFVFFVSNFLLSLFFCFFVSSLFAWGLIEKLPSCTQKRHTKNTVCKYFFHKMMELSCSKLFMRQKNKSMNKNKKCENANENVNG